jgi:hypothetical protein
VYRLPSCGLVVDWVAVALRGAATAVVWAVGMISWYRCQHKLVQENAGLVSMVAVWYHAVHAGET